MRPLSAAFLRFLAITVLVAAGLTCASFASDSGLAASATERAGIQSSVTQSLLQGHAEDAARQLDEWLKIHPDDPDALFLRATAARQGGNVAAALICMNRALYFRPEAKQDTDPASSWNQLLAALGASWLAKDSDASVEPPAWTWPPPAVLLNTIPTGALLPAESKTKIEAEIIPVNELVETVIIKDSHGQWAEKAKASSEYGSDNYGAVQATGAPNVPAYQDDGRSWASASADSQEEWLELTYAKAVHATGVRVRQSFNPGAIKRIELYDEAGGAHVVWSGVDPARGAQPGIAWFGLKFAATTFTTQRVRLVIDSPAVRGWNQIDAVQLLGE